MDAKQWEQLLLDAGLETSSALEYSKTFADEKLSRDHLQSMDRAMLQELGVTAMGDSLSILQLGKQSKPTESSSSGKSKNNACKLPVKAPTLHADMTSQQYRKFLIDWDVF